MTRIKTFFLWCHYLLQFFTRPIAEHKAVVKNFVLRLGDKTDIRVLDFGCGEGIFSDMFLDEGHVRYTGADKDLACLRFTNTRYRATTYVASNEALSFKRGAFDFILVNNVLHHMRRDEIRVLLRRIRDVLKENGFLMVIELAPSRQWKSRFLRFVVWFEEKFRGIAYFNDGVLKNFLTEFDLIKAEDIGHDYIHYVFIPKPRTMKGNGNG